MTTTDLASKTAALETRLLAMEARLLEREAEIAELRERVERSELEAIERRGDAEVARGQTVPVRESLEMFRRKRNIPAT